MNKQIIKCDGLTHFRQKLLCSLLSGKPVEFNNVEPSSFAVHHQSLLSLIQKVTKGTLATKKALPSPAGPVYKISFTPGVLICGSFLSHDCEGERGLSYFIEVLLILGLFSKHDLNIILRGYTNHFRDVSVDMIRNSTFSVLKSFGVENRPTLQILKRGVPPGGVGEVKLVVPIVRNSLKPVHLLKEGMIKRIRGIAFCAGLHSSNSEQIVKGAREFCNKLIPDVWIVTDNYSGEKAGGSKGFGLFLQAETDNFCNYSAEYSPQGGIASNSGMTAEDLGKFVSGLLIQEVKNGGCMDSLHQWLYLFLMVVTSEDVSRVRMGKLSDYAIGMLKNLKEFFGVMFKITPEPETQTFVVSCRGYGYKNVSRKSV